LATGAWADVVVLDRDLQLQSIYIEGNSIDHIDAL
jgi:N-acetylglucosamine-6-phosphate deacetylase